MNKLLFVIFAAVLLAAACSQSVVSPGNEIRGSLPEKTHTLSDAWPGAGNILLAHGCPVQLDTYTEIHDISGSGIMSISVRSLDFDPVAAVIDGDGNLIAFSSSWKNDANSRLVLDGAPSGGKLLVFSPDDSRGLYDVIVEEASLEDLAAYIEATDFSDGLINARINEDGSNPYLEDILQRVLMDYVYIYNYGQAKLFPFTVEDSELISISLESIDFDPYLVILAVEDGTYSFVDYNDDYDGSYSRIIRNFEPGEYIAVVMPYSEGDSGDFSLLMEPVNEEALETIGIQASLQNTDYTGEILQGLNLAIGWWPGMLDDWEAPGFLSPFGPVAGFTFTVEDISVCELNASGDMDVCLTVLQLSEDAVTCVAYNDDFMDLGTNSRVVQPLVPGDYVALVSAYSGTEQGEVTFSWSGNIGAISALRAGRLVEEFVPYETASLIYRLSLQAGRDYSVSVESEMLDPVITIAMPDGETLYDDDGGDGTNSLLYFSASEAGDAFLFVEKYTPDEGTFEILFDTEDR